MSIPVFCSYIRRKDMDTVLSCLVRDSLGPGDYLDRFQKSAREYLGYEYGTAFRGPDAALRVAIEALGLVAGDAALLPALAPAYYAYVLATLRIEPVFFDVAPDVIFPTPETIAAAIESAPTKPSCVLLFEAVGVMPEPEGIRSLGLPVIEDISQSLGAYQSETKAGTIGQMTLLGLENGSLVTSGGGALLYSQGKREAQVLRNLSADLPAELRMTDYNAALGFAQFKELESALARRRELYRLFSQTLAQGRHRLLSQAGEGEPGYWALPLALSSGVKEVRAYAKKKEVETEPAFEDSCLAKGLVPEGTCPNARSLLLRTLLFPLHQRVGVAGAQKISKVLATLP